MSASARRLIVYYAILAAVTVVVVVVVFAAGSDEKTQPAIAGGYDVAPPAARCTGLQMDVTQSGEFVGLRRPDGTVLSNFSGAVPHGASTNVKTIRPGQTTRSIR